MFLRTHVNGKPSFYQITLYSLFLTQFVKGHQLWKKLKQNPNPFFSFFPVASVSVFKYILLYVSPKAVPFIFSLQKQRPFFPLVCTTDWFFFFFVHSIGFYAVRGHELHIEFMLTQ